MFQIEHFNGFAGGINRGLAPRDIADNELVDAVNMELNRRRGLRKRSGTSLIKSGAQPFGTDDVDSIYHFRQTSGSNTVLYAAGANAWRRAPSDPESVTAYTAIDGSVTLPSDPRWEWVTFDDVAIGVNGADPTSLANPVVLTSTSGSLVDTGVSGDNWLNKPSWTPKHIEVWNRRVWISSGNYLYGSKLGDHTDWDAVSPATGVSIKVGQDVAGGEIKAIKSYLGRLFVFFENAIYQIIPDASNPVDETKYYTTPLTHKLGCVDAKTIQYVGNDMVFLSHEGVSSLRATDEFGDVQHAILSWKVPELAETDKSATRFQSIVHPTKQQYWLALSSSALGGDNDVVWVMDYAAMGNAEVPWMRFDGAVVGASYGLVYYEGRPTIYIGGYDGYAYVYDESKFGDVVVTPSPAYALTKAFDMGQRLLRSEYYRVGTQFEVLSSDLTVELGWKLDEHPNRTKVVTTQYESLVDGSILGPGSPNAILWDDPPTTGSFILGSDEEGSLTFITGIKGPAGRRAQTIQLSVAIPNDDEGAELRSIRLDYAVLFSNRGNAAGVADEGAAFPPDLRVTQTGTPRVTHDGRYRTIN